jgi:dolichol-phosphate mannosyltransferase
MWVGKRGAMSRVCVMLPTFDEAGTIEEVLRRLRAALPEATLLVIDDGSPDGTADIAERCGQGLGRTTVLRRAGKLGLGSAYRFGLAWAADHDHQIAVAMDSDLSHEPEVARDLVSELFDERVHLAVGSRYIPGGGTVDWSWHRRALSRGGNAYVRLMLGLPTRDATSGFRAYRLSSLRRLGIDTLISEGYTFQIEVVHRISRAYGDDAVVEVPILFRERLVGRSKMSPKIATEAVRNVTRWAIDERRDRSSAKGPLPTGESQTRSSSARDDH